MCRKSYKFIEDVKKSLQRILQNLWPHYNIIAKAYARQNIDLRLNIYTIEVVNIIYILYSDFETVICSHCDNLGIFTCMEVF